MVVLVTVNNDKDQIKNEGSIDSVLITLNIKFSSIQGQLTLQSVVGSGRKSNTFEILWLPLYCEE